MGDVITTTPFEAIYDSFFSRITDDMYMEWTKEDTEKDVQNILLNAIPRFEFPRFNSSDYQLGKLVEVEVTDPDTGIKSTTQQWVGGFFNAVLTNEEINIFAIAMVVEWLGRQLATTENTRMKVTGSDFKMTSQANHMAKLNTLIESYKADCFKMQRLYKRRKVSAGGVVESTFGQIMEVPPYGFKI